MKIPFKLLDGKVAGALIASSMRVFLLGKAVKLQAAALCMESRYGSGSEFRV